MKYYEPKHFCVQEYVSPQVYDELGDRAILLMDDRVLKTDDAIREFFGQPVTINNWHRRGNRTGSGFRAPVDMERMRKEGVKVARWSQHQFGRASDKLISGVSAEEARRAIIGNRKNFPFITVIEDKVSWLHTDCRCVAGNNLILFNP